MLHWLWNTQNPQIIRPKPAVGVIKTNPYLNFTKIVELQMVYIAIANLATSN